jgi:plasmid stability protein
MATLNIKNFPDPLYEKLQERAQREHRSVTQEVIHILDQTLEEEKPLSIMELEGLGKELWEGRRGVHPRGTGFLGLLTELGAGPMPSKLPPP